MAPPPIKKGCGVRSWFQYLSSWCGNYY